MNKKRVKFMESIAGLADPKPVSVLDEKYDKMRDQMRRPAQGREKGVSEYTINTVIAETKLRDRYGEKQVGFARDYSFKPGDEASIDAELADKWDALGLLTILGDVKKAA